MPKSPKKSPKSPKSSKPKQSPRIQCKLLCSSPVRLRRSPKPQHARLAPAPAPKSPSRKKRQSLGRSYLKGGLFKGAGTFGCGFTNPLATIGATGAKSAGARIGKIMNAVNAETELVAMRPFMALDPTGQWGVYASDAAPLHVDLATAVESAGGQPELAQCHVESLQSARRIAVGASLKAPGQERQAYINNEIEKITKIKQTFAVLTAAWNAMDPGPEKTKKEVDRYIFYQTHSSDIAYDGMDQLEFNLASAGDMDKAIAALQSDVGRPTFSVVLIHAHLMAFSNLTRGLAAYHVNSLVHRDIKPLNIVLASGTLDAPGEYKFIDFGESLPLQKAATDKYQAAPYLYWPIYTLDAFLRIAKTNDDDITKIVAAHKQKVEDYKYEWLPQWMNTTETLKKAQKNLLSLVKSSSPGAVAAIHADLFALYIPTLAELYWSLTGVRFTHDATEIPMTEAAFEIYPPLDPSPAFATSEFGKLVSMALAQLMVDVSWGVVSNAVDAAARFQIILDMFVLPKPAVIVQALGKLAGTKQRRR